MTKLTKNLLTTAGLLTLMTWSAACATNQEEGTAQAAQVNAMMNAQAAAGARADATLYPFHFEGARLNSTGQEKLDRMLPDENGASHDATAATTDVANASPMTVYLDVPADDANRRSYQ